MARAKKLWLIVSFSTVTAAMAAENYCLEHEIPGRTIPLPGQIRAGCGLAWRSETAEKERLIKEFKDAGIAWEAMQECLL